MKTDWEKLNNAYEACMFLDSLKEEQVIGITIGNFESFYVFYKKE